MKTAKKLILASIVLPLILSTTSVFAHGGKEPQGPRHECRPGLDRDMMKELNLSDSQKEQFKELRQSNKEAMKERFKDKPQADDAMRDAHFNKLNDLLLADKFDPAKATALAQEMANKQVERQVNMLSNQHKMLSILTPEQKAAFIELQKERMEDCADDMPRHHGKDRN
ncbi:MULTISPECIES: CpxP family protein [Marinomonas]|uniref:CpxP family protein n=1 Tax=Marinomonas arctica TaxID=383750 RepID=A0A7H1J2Q4_9GAMM|nr:MULTISPECIES: CpxP family protein [Marinomonas]MCS7486482.1 periplasmic repressor CpxP [Marinomonas sp. BSi20414]QNT04770.1 CpxP family protein [Marinomonas arctica]GGN30772.1 periplasmic repressor CpxP [Marinomonas arctica]